MFRFRPAEEDVSQADTASTIHFWGVDDSSSDDLGVERQQAQGGGAWELRETARGQNAGLPRQPQSMTMRPKQRGAAGQGVGVDFLEEDDSEDERDMRVASWLERQGSAPPTLGVPVGIPTTFSSPRSPSQRQIAQVRATATAFAFVRRAGLADGFRGWSCA